MKILIAPDKFKSSLTSDEVCDAIAEGILKYNPLIEIIKHPMADGGEGVLDVIAKHQILKTVKTEVLDPLGRKITASFKMRDNIAYIEMSSASGLMLLNASERNPLITSSFGTGQLINAAIKNGANEIYLFVGGSATNDAGTGMAAALGYTFLDVKDDRVYPTGANLTNIVKILRPPDLKKWKSIHFKTVCDVTNPLYGPNGAAFIYAAQKGASHTDIDKLDKALQHISKIIKKDLGADISQISGSGAAGGMGGGSVAFLDAEIVSGINMIIDVTGLKDKMIHVDLIISGEGRLDDQTLQGKVISGVASLAIENHLPLALLCGKSEISPSNLKLLNPKYLKTIAEIAESEGKAIENAKFYLNKLAFDLIKHFVEN